MHQRRDTLMVLWQQHPAAASCPGRRIETFFAEVLQAVTSVPLWLKLFGSNPSDGWAGGSWFSFKEKRTPL